LIRFVPRKGSQTFTDERRNYDLALHAQKHGWLNNSLLKPVVWKASKSKKTTQERELARICKVLPDLEHVIKRAQARLKRLTKRKAALEKQLAKAEAKPTTAADFIFEYRDGEECSIKC